MDFQTRRSGRLGVAMLAVGITVLATRGGHADSSASIQAGPTTPAAVVSPPAESTDSWVGRFDFDERGRHISHQSVVLLFVLALVVLRSWRRRSDTQARLETVRILAEKGQPIPSALFESSKNEGGFLGISSLRRAIVQVGLGVGLFLYSFNGPAHDRTWAFGVGFLVMGIGNLWLASKSEKL